MNVKKLIGFLWVIVVVCMMSVFSYAAGWIEIDGEWGYIDNEGLPLTETIKSSDGEKYYLDENGRMVRDYLLEDYNDAIYYFDDEGRMVSNTWVAVDPQQVSNPLEDGPTVYLYYFGANGKAYKATDGAKRKTIDGKKYLFDEEGRMLSGWINENGEMFTSQDVNEDPFQNEYIYYAGDETDGVLKEGWYEYIDGSLSEDYYDKESMWFYFNPSSNKKVRCDGTGNVQRNTKREYITRKINGHTYAFDENGVMLVGWEAETATRYYAENKKIEGQLVKKEWIFTIPPEGLPGNTDYNDQIERWFYASKSGDITKSIIKKINGKDYVFDNNGIMKSGLVIVDRYTREYVATIDIESTDGKEFLVDRKYIDKDTELPGYFHKEKQILYYFKDDEFESDFGSRKLGNVTLAFSDKDYIFSSEKNGEKEGPKSKDKKYYQHGITLIPDPFIGYGIVLDSYGYPATYPSDDQGVQSQRKYDAYRAAVYKSTDSEIADIVRYTDEDGNNITNEYYVAYDDGRYGGDTDAHYAPFLKVVDSSGKRIRKNNVVKKDKNGNYWIIGINGEFIKVVSVPVKYNSSAGWQFRSEIGSSSGGSERSKTTYIPFGTPDIYGKTVMIKRQNVLDPYVLDPLDNGYDVALDDQYALNFSWVKED